MIKCHFIFALKIDNKVIEEYRDLINSIYILNKRNLKSSKEICYNLNQHVNVIYEGMYMSKKLPKRYLSDYKAPEIKENVSCSVSGL